ncbi:MAG: hypothetical protein HKP61_03475 [Dactylosporangium sp.]|nr:hypothetical protein [Dactylosporangium sp.]NNJ60014.1 hypothetical protein [Dactylosporangium sp.]
MDPPEPRTLLEQIFQHSRWTIDETCREYEKTARQMREQATLSPRQLWRWMSGETAHARPVAQRVAERYWGHPFDILTGPPEATGDREDEIGPQQQATAGAEQIWSSTGCGRESEAGDHTDRRTALRAFAGTTVGIGLASTFGQAAAEAMEFTRRAEASDLGPRTLDHLELVVVGMASAFPHTPPAQMFPIARAYRQQVATLIAGKQTLRQRRELYRYAGWLSIILGWLSHDLADPVAAEAHYLDAWEHGWQAEDGEICGWAMDTAATIAMYANQPQRARDAAIRGATQAPAGSAAAVRLACQRTRAHGRLGEARQFDESLADTRRQLDHLPDQGTGLFSADAGRIDSYAATASIWLHRPDQAVTYAQQAIDFYDTVPQTQRSPTRQAIAHLDLGLALISMKTPDGAAEVAFTALNSERITGAVLTRAAEVDSAFQRSYPRLPATRDLHDRYLDLVQSRSGDRQLTAASGDRTVSPATHPDWLR